MNEIFIHKTHTWSKIIFILQLVTELCSCATYENFRYYDGEWQSNSCTNSEKIQQQRLRSRLLMRFINKNSQSQCMRAVRFKSSLILSLYFGYVLLILFSSFCSSWLFFLFLDWFTDSVQKILCTTEQQNSILIRKHFVHLVHTIQMILLFIVLFLFCASQTNFIGFGIVQPNILSFSWFVDFLSGYFLCNLWWIWIFFPLSQSKTPSILPLNAQN